MSTSNNESLLQYEQWTLDTPIEDIIYKFNTVDISDKERELITLANPTKLLDIGCGNGARIFTYLESQNIDFIGIEKFAKIVNSGNGKYTNHIIVNDILTIDSCIINEKLQGVDTITIFGGSLNGLFSYEDQYKAWSIIVSIIDNSGIIIFEAYNLDGYETFDQIGVVRHFPELPPQFYLTEKENFKIWRDLKLQVISYENYHIPHRNKVKYYILKKMN